MENRWVRDALTAVESRCTGQALARHHRITLNFHPDRALGGITILYAMVRDGVYRSQFETGTSNGGLTAHVGGDRWVWERSLFSGAYDDAPPAERPKYGALNHRHRSLGGAPRFGSAHLRLREHMLDRATFCFPDSAMAPQHFATANSFDLLRLADEHDSALAADPDDESRDPLDGYVEAQVHGEVVLAQDVEALVLDPCFQRTWVQAQAEALGVPVEWHEGRVLTTDELVRREDYRGSEPVRIGLEVASEGKIDALAIGEAAASGRYPVQPVKQLWHLTAMWGGPADAS